MHRDAGVTLRRWVCVAFFPGNEKRHRGETAEGQHLGFASEAIPEPVCTENLIRVDDVMESPKLAE
jgi:hypothetical protein